MGAAGPAPDGTGHRPLGSCEAIRLHQRHLHVLVKAGKVMLDRHHEQAGGQLAQTGQQDGALASRERFLPGRAGHGERELQGRPALVDDVCQLDRREGAVDLTAPAVAGNDGGGAADRVRAAAALAAAYPAPSRAPRDGPTPSSCSAATHTITVS